MPGIALVYPYFRTRSATELLFPPLGAAGLAGQLLKLRVEARVFDCTFHDLAWIKNGLKAYQPDIVGIYTMVTLSRNTFQIAEMVRKELPDSLLVSGGPLPTLYPERFCTALDVVFRGEADLSFPRFCQALLNLQDTHRYLELPLESYEGLFIQHNGIRINNPTVHHSEKVINTFALPHRDDFDHSAYQKVWSDLDGSKTTSIITTLGCPFSCDFCSRPVFGSRIRRRDLDIVLEEIRQIKQLGYDSLWIADDNFTLDFNYLKEFCQRISGTEINWSCLSRVTGIDETITNMMKDSGCIRVHLGLETGNQTTMEIMKKKATVEQGLNAVNLFHKAGITVAAFFIVGYPGETISSIEDTFRFALELPLDSISFNVPYPLPGSPLFERVKKVKADEDWNEENETTFLYDSEFDPAWIKSRISATMKTFAEKHKQC
jgi:anaerobic magnesium-protoporphyrin IX monomethyl ester cyclase